jgi:hypothetical protein
MNVELICIIKVGERFARLEYELENYMVEFSKNREYKSGDLFENS